MTSLHFSTPGDGRLRKGHVAEIRGLHMQFGLLIAFFRQPEAAVTLDSDPCVAMTEILRLATLGVEAEAMVRAGVDGKVSELVSDADVNWTRVFK